MIDTTPRPSSARSVARPEDPPTGAFLTLGIDVGGTKTAYVVTDAHDEVLLDEVVATDAARLPAQLIELVGRARERFPETSSQKIAGVGVCMPGRVDPQTGNVRMAVNLGGRDMALGPLLEESLGLPCSVEHDARAAAAWVAARPGTSDDIAYLSVGTGIAAGIVLNGKLLRGANGLAGEIGHVSADPDAARCACGLPGCVEAVAAGPAMARESRSAITSGRATTLDPQATASDVFRAAVAGDALASELATEFGERLARAIRGLALTLGVTHIVIGGGVADAGDALLRAVLDAISRERAASPLVEAAFAGARIEVLSPEARAGARGAAAFARQRVLVQQREGVGGR